MATSALVAQLDAGPKTRLGVVDGSQLDSVATGGFLGLWLGVYGTSNGAESTTTVAVDSVEYLPD